MRSLYNLFFLCCLVLFSSQHLYAQTGAPACNLTSEGGTLTEPTESVCIGDAVNAPAVVGNTAGLEVTEYLLANTQSQLSDAEFPDKNGAEVLAINTTGQFNPADYGLQDGDSFEITAVSYDLSNLQAAIDVTLNGNFLFIPCCELIQEALGADLCGPIEAAGVDEGSDLTGLSVYFDIMEQSGEIQTVENVLYLIDNNFNPNDGQPCTDGLPICYATTNTITYSYEECVTCPPAGTACDDGDATTTNDVEDGECNCAGTPCPTAGTTCDDGNAATTNDIEDGECNCTGTPCPEAGTSCDDGDASTTNDTEDGACNCAGTPCPPAGTACDDGDPTTTNDIEDGFCNCSGGDCPEAGTLCDDGDAATTNDVQDGECNCAGTPCPEAGTSCDDGDASTTNDIEDGECNCAGTPCPPAGTACDDGDPSTDNDIEDGFCNCSGGDCPEAGTPCDDGDATTTNDVHDGECNCAGTPCAEAGTSCDDGDASTTNDTEDGECNCTGTPCPAAGTACDDNNPATENDIEDGECNCAGTPIVMVNTGALRLQVLLEGYYNGSELRTTYQQTGLFPTTQPYAAAPYNYNGNETVSPEQTMSDWLLIEARSAADVNTVVARKAVLVHNDGTVRDQEGNEAISFADLEEGNYHIALFHRGHLAVVSASPVAYNDDAPLLDFTLNAEQAMGESQLKQIGDKYGLYAGDLNGDGRIDEEDFELWLANGAKVNTNLPADADGSTIINVKDHNLWKRNNGKIGHPSIGN